MFGRLCLPLHMCVSARECMRATVRTRVGGGWVWVNGFSLGRYWVAADPLVCVFGLLSLFVCVWVCGWVWVWVRGVRMCTRVCVYSVCACVRCCLLLTCFEAKQQETVARASPLKQPSTKSPNRSTRCISPRLSCAPAPTRLSCWSLRAQPRRGRSRPQALTTSISDRLFIIVLVSNSASPCHRALSSDRSFGRSSIVACYAASVIDQ